MLVSVGLASVWLISYNGSISYRGPAQSAFARPLLNVHETFVVAAEAFENGNEPLIGSGANGGQLSARMNFSAVRPRVSLANEIIVGWSRGLPVLQSEISSVLPKDLSLSPGEQKVRVFARHELTCVWPVGAQGRRVYIVSSRLGKRSLQVVGGVRVAAFTHDQACFIDNSGNGTNFNLGSGKTRRLNQVDFLAIDQAGGPIFGRYITDKSNPTIQETVLLRADGSLVSRLSGRIEAGLVDSNGGVLGVLIEKRHQGNPVVQMTGHTSSVRFEGAAHVIAKSWRLYWRTDFQE